MNFKDSGEKTKTTRSGEALNEDSVLLPGIRWDRRSSRGEINQLDLGLCPRRQFGVRTKRDVFRYPFRDVHPPIGRLMTSRETITGVNLSNGQN